MSASVIPKLEPSENPTSPISCPAPPHSPSEDGAVKRVPRLSDSWNVSQSGVPDDDDADSCALNLSMCSRDWNSPIPPCNTEDSDRLNVSLRDSSFMNVSSSCGDNSALDVSVSSESSQVMNLTNNSENSGYMSAKPENSGYTPASVENTSAGSITVKMENTFSGEISVKLENDTGDYAKPSQDNSNSAQDIAENENLINISDSPESNLAMDLSSSAESSDIINVTDTAEVINVTSTTQDEPSNIPVSPEQEVVDVESYQPCVVDLTCEEEDDVDVVAVVEPVIFIGTEQGREPRRRNRGNNPSPQLEDLTDSEVAQEPNNRINDDTNNNNAVAHDERNDLWPMNNPPEIDLQNPNLTFGSLLGQVPVETVDDSQQQQQHHHRPSAPIPRTYRELRNSARRRRPSRSRSRSPSLFPDMDFHYDNQHADIMNALEGFMHDISGSDWAVPPPVPNTLPLDANQLVAEEHHQRVARIVAPKPPPSPPPVEQPTISCLVCLDSVATINSSARSLCSTVCGHVFCSACIEEVVKQRKQCPVCRKKLTKRQYHPLFI